MSKHTPGPWSAAGNVIYPNLAGEKCIAKVSGILSAENDEEYLEFEANTHLIAAAPQMLEALEAAISALEDASCLGFNLTEQMKKVDAAIGAAKGKV